MERIEALREICQAGKLSEPGWYTIHRRLSIRITWALLHTPVAPTHVTLAMMAAGAAGALMLAAPSLAVNLGGFALLYLSFLLDKVDGEIARYRGVAAPRAVVLDRFHHLAIEPAMLVAAGWREYAAHGAPGPMFAALAAVVIGNVIEEQPHLAPYALVKHLRELGEFPRRTGRVARSAIDSLYPIFRALKVFRMFIAVVPSLLLAYVTQAFTGAPLVTAYLVAAVTALAVYLLFQTAWYFDIKLEGEIASMRGLFRTGAPGAGHRLLPIATDAVVAFPGTGSSRSANEGRTVGPRTVSGAKRHETPTPVVRDHTP